MMTSIPILHFELFYMKEGPIDILFYLNLARTGFNQETGEIMFPV